MIYIACIAVLFALTVWFGLRNIDINLRKSLSVHIGKSQQSIMFARVSLTIIGVLLLLWFFTHYLASHTAYFDNIVGIVLFSITIMVQGLFPYGQRHSWNQIHDIAAWTAACLGPALLLRFAAVVSGPIQLPLTLFGLLSLCILLALILIKPVRKYFLVLQLTMVIISGICFALLSI